MTTIKFDSRRNPPLEDKVFDYSVNAKTYLLLAGYLPTTEDPNYFINIYTAETARIEMSK